MSELSVALVLAASGFLAHWMFAQAWLEQRGGLRHVWNFHESTPALIFTRVTLVLAIAFALLMAVPPLRFGSAVLASALFILHLTGMAILKDRI
jgi:hypothetical protein